MKKLLTLAFVFVTVLTLSACALIPNIRGAGNRRPGLENSAAPQTAQRSTKAESLLPDHNQQTNENTQSAQSSPKITADEALSIALDHAGVTKDSIRDLENELDRDDGILVYEISFESGNTEFSYDINAETGIVHERDRDREY